MPRHRPAAASRTSRRGKARFGEFLSPGVCVGLYDAHKSGGRQGRRSSRADHGYRLSGEEQLEVDLMAVACLVQLASHLSAGASYCSPRQSETACPGFRACGTGTGARWMPVGA